MASSDLAKQLPAPVATEPATLRQHNAILSARYDYSACQLDILFYLLSVLRRADPDGYEYQLYAKDMEAVSGRRWTYQQLREATAGLGSRMFELESEQTYQQLWMFQGVEYVKGQGCVRLQLAAPIRPYLFQLKEAFTSTELYSELKLTSKYAKRIYQLVSQWQDQPATPTYFLGDLKEMLHLKDPKGKSKELFENISQLKARVLDIAVRQVSEHTHLRIDYKLTKRGKAFEKVYFTIERQSPPQIPISFEQQNDAS
jgi:plasmid replication initiation protein